MSKPHRQRSSAVLRKGHHHGKSQLDGSFCQYAHRICMQDRLDGYDFCIDHILQDKNAAFKQCNFVSPKNGEKCTRATPKADKRDGYCKEHNRKASVLRYKATLKHKPKDAAQQILDELDYYLPGSSKKFPDAPVSTIGKVLDYASGSDSDTEPTQLEQTYQADYDSDADSVDSEPEDALRYAEVYTAEEVALITKDKLIRLQSLYINQFRRLQHLMKEKRREFLLNLKKEIPVYGPNLGRISDSKEKKRLKKLKAMVSYRKRKGRCAVLQRKSKNRRIKVTQDYNGPVKATKLPVCSFQSCPGQACDKPCVPLVKYCIEHVFLDPQQVLFKRCSEASGFCQRVAVPYSKGRTCILHQEVPPYNPRVWKLTRLQKRKESASSLASSALSTVSAIEPINIPDPLPFFPDMSSVPSTSRSLLTPITINQQILAVPGSDEPGVSGILSSQKTPECSAKLPEQTETPKITATPEQKIPSTALLATDLDNSSSKPSSLPEHEPSESVPQLLLDAKTGLMVEKGPHDDTEEQGPEIGNGAASNIKNSEVMDISEEMDAVIDVTGIGSEHVAMETN